jgi:FkbM family methyltransferase
VLIVQRGLLKLFRAGLLRGPARRLLENRTWQIEGGEAAGLKLSFPQNLDFVSGSTEVPMQRCVVEHLAPGGVFYDVGANIGFFSLLATKRVGATGSVYAFEPVAENAAAIRHNASLNGLSTLSVFEVAIEEHSGTGELFLTKWDGGSSLSTAAVAPSEPIERRPVQVMALDDLIQSRGLRPPTLVKVDVEGAELGVLRGMLRTIAEFKPVLVYEVDDGNRAAFVRRWKELDGFVTGLGYQVMHLQDSYSNVNWQVGHSLALPLAAPSAMGIIT